MATQFPFHPDVQLHLSAAQPIPAKIRVRVPIWAAQAHAYPGQRHAGRHRQAGNLRDPRSDLV